MIMTFRKIKLAAAADERVIKDKGREKRKVGKKIPTKRRKKSQKKKKKREASLERDDFEWGGGKWCECGSRKEKVG